MNKKALITMMLPFLLTACSGSSNNTSDSSGGDDAPVVIIDKDEYDDWANTWSKPGHLYFHYNRGDKKGYENYCLWLWQHDPQDLEGALWGFSADPKVSDKLTLQPMTTSFMTYEDVHKADQGSGTFIDNFGVIFDVDLNAAGLKGGKSGAPTSYEGASELGFLLPQQDSMSGATNWVSDGGRETYLEEINDSAKWRTIGDGKAIHVFVATGALDDYAFFAGEATAEAKVNPINDDTTGQYSSAVDTKYSNSLDNSSTSDAFKTDGVGYQIFVSSFRDGDGDKKGDLRGIINALDEGFFDDLNVNVLWLTPIQKSDSYHGYDISDYYQVDKKFGTIDDYAELLYKCHNPGYNSHRTKKIKVLMDLVLNHTSKSNKWFINSQWGVEDDIKWRDVYTWKFETELIDKWNGSSYEKVTVKADAESSNPSWYRDGESHYYYYGKFGSGMPEINYLSKATRSLVINMAKYWLSFGLDGFRLDAVKHIFMRDECFQEGDQIITDVGQATSYDTEKGIDVTKDYDYSSNLTKNIMWWKEFAHGVKSAYPNCFLVGENFDGWGTRTAPYYQALDSQFDFATYYHIASMIYTWNNVEGSSVEDAHPSASTYASSHITETYDAFSSPYDLPLGDSGASVKGGARPDFIDGNFTSNHDVMRAINAVNWSYVKINPDGSKTYVANDNITGTNNQINRARVHAAITLLGQGLSWIYYGDELGMSSNTNDHGKYKVNQNNIDIWYRQPFLWKDTSKRADYKSGMFKFELDSYNKTVKSMEDQKADQWSMLQWYKDIIAIKKQFPTNADVHYYSKGSGNVLEVVASPRTGTEKTIYVYINIGVDSSWPVEGLSDKTYFGGSKNSTSDDVGGTPFSVRAYRAN